MSHNLFLEDETLYLYLLTNTVNGKQYVGMTSRKVSKRFMEHLQKAKNGTTLLARALHKYGGEAFTLEVIGEASDWAALCQAEQDAIIAYNTLHPHGYNITEGGGGALGRKHTEETKRRISEKKTGTVHDQAFRDKVSARMKGVPKSPEQRRKMGEWQRGARNSQFGKMPAHHGKMLEAIAQVRVERGDPRKGRPLSEEHRMNLSKALKGRTYSEAQKRAHSTAQHGHPQSEETRAKIRAATLAQLARQGNPMQGRTHSEATKQRISAANKGKTSHPAWNKGQTMSEEFCEKVSAGLQGRDAWNKGIPWHVSTGGKEHPKSRAVELNGQRYVSVMACHRATGLGRNTIKKYIAQGKARYVEDE